MKTLFFPWNIWQTTPKAQMPNPVELWSFGDNSAMLSLVGAGSLCRGHHHHPKLGWEPKTPRDAWLGQRCDCDKFGFAQNCFGRAETWRSGRKGTWGYLYSGCSRAAMFDQGPLPGGTLSTQRHTHTAWPTVSAPILSKITPFGAGLKGKCVRLDLPGLGPALVAWAGGEKSDRIQVPAAEASLFYVQMLNWHKHSFFFKAQCWFVEFNDFLRYLFSYLFPLSIGSRLFNIFNGIFLSVFLN